ncbi:MAG: hypothetical protein N2205_02170 [Candidatus Caldatribacterium sp.]|uniref:hypothetical protein n=1 Tax=Candidatus Caldatribacterium sp. TaxID=2282143 RepID=UPI0029963A2A|nr:hypothetical protein [Candidatus Caldatribacterium sp.]MCX7730012.1 hypothetical protein [Candidatus Caldatribacterium sp.]MDW8081115.1 hypothetical protein [Candidatus Calescibacterium sp.]
MTKVFLRLRGAVALGMVILIYFMITTGTLLWIAHYGGTLPEGLWSFASRAHPVVGTVFFALSFVHVALNKKLFASDLSALFGREKK